MIINLIVFFAVLSLLIFFHELGHFLAAKAFGIYVKRFSIGMPPRLFGFQWGETDYCVGALPIGGFVMMAGQEDVPLSDEEREEQYGNVPEERWFKNKPVLQRVCVLLAGPTMNLLLAVLLYAIVGLVGSMVPEWEVEARVGDIETNAPVLEAPLYLYDAQTDGPAGDEAVAVGWQVGDKIVKVDGRSISNMTDLAVEAVLGGDEKSHTILLERSDEDGVTTQYLSYVTPKILDDTRHPRFGVGPFETALIGYILDDSPAAAAGFQEGDIIREIDDIPVSLTGFISYIEDRDEGSSVSITVERDGKQKNIAVMPHTIGRVRGLKFGALNTDDLWGVVSAAAEQSEAFDLKPGDTILEVNGEPCSAETFHEMETSHPGESIALTVKRPAKMFGMVQDEKIFTVTVPIDPVRAIGVSLRPQLVLQRIPPTKIVQHAFYQSYLAVDRTIMTIVGLVRRTVSPKELGGPLMIFEVTTRAAQAGLDWLMKITAFISINLFILNLLPLPVPDGGQVLVNGIEALRGKPVNEKFLERMQQVGIILLIALMLYVTYNDLERFIMGWLS